MQASNQNSRSQSAMDQAQNNVTAWLGHPTGDTKNVTTGQTFEATKEADLESITVYVSVVAVEGDVALSLHSFDTFTQTWGAQIATTNVNFTKDCNGKWVTFNLPALHLTKGSTYGFKLASKNSYVGVGEAVGSAQEPLQINGKKWQFVNNAATGNSYKYFSLAYKLGLKAA
jgi:hypothetical protein